MSPSESNDFVYNQLNYMMDKLVYDIATLSGGVLPKVNLIAHSRGGITNMQYALDHPDLVDSMFSLGTPYHGSKLGQSEFILNFLDMSNDPNNKDQYSDGVGDIMNPNVSNTYKDRWNSGYKEKYSGINFHAIAGYSSLNFVNKIVNDDEFNCAGWLKALVTAGDNSLIWLIKLGGLQCSPFSGQLEL